MANDSPDVVTTFIAVVEAKIKALQALLESLRSAVAVGAFGTGESLELPAISTAGNGEIGPPIDLPEGAFHGKSIPSCIKLYLSSVKKKKTAKEIAVALQEGGVETTSDKFENNVTSSLTRLKLGGEVLRFKDGWGLTEWYPAHIRSATPVGAPKRGKKKAKAKKSKSSAVQAETQAIITAPKPIGAKIIDVLRSGKKSEYSLADIGEQVGMKIFGTRLHVGKLVKAGKIEKTQNDMYRSPTPKLVAASQ
jgi:hypothetical protein